MYLVDLDLPPCSDGPPDDDCFEGLTPGYWKTHGPNAPGGQANDWDNITGRFVYAADAEAALTYEQLIFGEAQDDVSWSLPGGRKPVVLEDLSVADALSIGGGGVNALARHSMAAILNARDEDVNYFANEAEICQWTAAALASGSVLIDEQSYTVDMLTELFAGNNELGLEPCLAIA